LGKNRDRISIIAAILDAANSGNNKTKIMITANLSFSLVNKYLNIALKLEYVEYSNSIYKCTLLGKNFLLRYKRFNDRFVQIQKASKELAEEHKLLVSLATCCS